MFDTDAINEFISEIRKLPSVSKKQAEKIVLWILNNDYQKVALLANSFKKLKEKITFCPICQAPSEINSCRYCNDPKRENTLLIVEHFSMIDKIEKTESYKGKYYTFEFLLKNESMLDLVMYEIEKLKEYAQNFDEIILGISPTLHGEMTNIIIKKELSKIGLNVSQMAIGVPVGASIDFVDTTTLKFSIKNRQK